MVGSMSHHQARNGSGHTELHTSSDQHYTITWGALFFCSFNFRVHGCTSYFWWTTDKFTVNHFKTLYHLNTAGYSGSTSQKMCARWDLSSDSVKAPIQWSKVMTPAEGKSRSWKKFSQKLISWLQGGCHFYGLHSYSCDRRSLIGSSQFTRNERWKSQSFPSSYCCNPFYIVWSKLYHCNLCPFCTGVWMLAVCLNCFDCWLHLFRRFYCWPLTKS